MKLKVETEIDAVTMKSLRFLAKKEKQPLRVIIRNALWSYTAPLHPDIRAGREPKFSAN
jgi:hypothetical protein